MIFLIDRQFFKDIEENTKEVREEFNIDIDEIIVDCLSFYVANINNYVTDGLIMAEILHPEKIDTFKWRKQRNPNSKNKYRVSDLKQLYSATFNALSIIIQSQLRSLGVQPFNLNYRLACYRVSLGIVLEITPRV